QHDGQGRREVLAVARAADEEELVQRLERGLGLRERVAKAGGQEVVQLRGGLVGLVTARGHLAGKPGDAGRQRRELQVAVPCHARQLGGAATNGGERRRRRLQLGL